MRIVHYPHPALKRVCKPLKRVDAELRDIVREMFELMYEHKGIGLAASQVGLPYRFFVLNLTGDREQSDEEMVFLNPVLSHPKGSSEAEEGCLSLPGVWAPVRRPETITIEAYTLEGEPFHETVDDLFARAVQHEVDHLDGVMFIDRLSPTARLEISSALQEFEADYASRRERGETPSDEEILAQLTELERLRA